MILAQMCNRMGLVEANSRLRSESNIQVPQFEQLKTIHLFFILQILDGDVITCMRTAAVSAISAKVQYTF